MTFRFAIVLLSLALPVFIHAQVVYALRSGPTIVAIEPGTGAETTAATGASGYIGISTYDPVGRRIFFTGPSTVLWSFAIDTGSLTQVPLAGSYVGSSTTR